MNLGPVSPAKPHLQDKETVTRADTQCAKKAMADIDTVRKPC